MTLKFIFLTKAHKLYPLNIKIHESFKITALSLNDSLKTVMCICTTFMNCVSFNACPFFFQRSFQSLNSFVFFDPNLTLQNGSDTEVHRIKIWRGRGPHILRPEALQVVNAPLLGFVGGVTGSSVLLENPAMIPMGVVQPWQNFLLHHVQVNCSVYLNPLGYENQRRFEAARWNCCPHHYRGWFLGFQVWFQPHWSAVDILW